MAGRVVGPEEHHPRTGRPGRRTGAAGARAGRGGRRRRPRRPRLARWLWRGRGARGAPCSRPWRRCRRSTAALVLDVAQELLAERCGRWRGSAPTTSMPSWTSLATSARPGAWRSSCSAIAAAALAFAPHDRGDGSAAVDWSWRWSRTWGLGASFSGAGAAVELAAGASGATTGHRWRPDRRAGRLEPSTSGFRVPSLPPPKVAKSRRKPRSVK
jgi:hypothetical protein